MKRIDWRVGLRWSLVALLAVTAGACEDTFLGADYKSGNVVIGSGVFGNGIQAASSWSGLGTEAKPWLITSAAGLKKLIDDVRNEGGSTSYSDSYFKLMLDIEITADEWIPIGSADTCYFSGHFDGNGKTIRGTMKSANYPFMGFFGYAYYGGTIENLTVTANVINGYNGPGVVYAGGLVGYSRSMNNIVNCHVTGSVTGGHSTDGGSYAGALGGFINGTRVENCSVTGSTVTGGNASGELVRSGTGGITGYLSNTTLRDCRISGATVTGGTSIESYTGGVAGYSFYGNIRTCEVSDTDITGGVGSVTDCTGGIAGVSRQLIANCTVSGGSLTGGVASATSCTGGIAGVNSAEIHLCSTSTPVVGGTAPVVATGGLVGENSGSGLFGCNTNTGTVDGAAARSESPDNRVGSGDPVNEEVHSEPR